MVVHPGLPPPTLCGMLKVTVGVNGAGDAARAEEDKADELEGDTRRSFSSSRRSAEKGSLLPLPRPPVGADHIAAWASFRPRPLTSKRRDSNEPKEPLREPTNSGRASLVPSQISKRPMQERIDSIPRRAVSANASKKPKVRRGEGGLEDKGIRKHGSCIRGEQDEKCGF